MFKSKFKVFSALILSVLLLATIFTKPVHILLAHHESCCDSCCTDQAHPQFSNQVHHACLICDFEFCSYIPQNKPAVPNVYAFVCKELTQRTVDRFNNHSSHLFQLRAPPVC